MGLIGKNIKFLREYMQPPLNQEAFGAIFGLSRGNISSYEEGRAEPKLDKTIEIAKYFSIAVEELATIDLSNNSSILKKGKEKGKVKGKVNTDSQNEMYISPLKKEPEAYGTLAPTKATIDYASGKDIRILPIIVDRNETEDNIPLVHTKAAAGYVDHLEEPEYVSKLPMFRLPGHDFRYGTFRAFEIEGESMIPELRPGWIVVGKFLDNWISGINDGRVYAVVPKNGRPVVKRLLNRIKKRGQIMLRSANPEYTTYPMYPEDISEIWEIKAFIGFDFPQNDRQLATDVNNLMADMAEMQFMLQELQKRLGEGS